MELPLDQLAEYQDEDAPLVLPSPPGSPGLPSLECAPFRAPTSSPTSSCGPSLSSETQPPLQHFDVVLPDSSAPPSRFRGCGHQWFLTYPMCPTPLGDVQRNVESFSRNGYSVAHYLIAQETHKDGQPHLHLLLQLKPLEAHPKDKRQRFRFSDPRLFDGLTRSSSHPQGHHCNIQRVKSWPDAVRYVRKEGNTVESPDFESTLTSVSAGKPLDRLIARIESGEDAQQIALQDPKLVLLYGNRLTLTLHLRACARQADHRIATLVSLTPASSSANEMQDICDWFNTRFGSSKPDLETPSGRVEWATYGRQQLYVHGPPAMNKSLFLAFTQLFTHFYLFPQEDFYDFYNPELHNFIALDEFTGGLRRLSWLNNFVDGTPMQLRRKGTTPVTKRGVTPVVIMSNYSPADAFANLSGANSTRSGPDGSFSAFASRFHVVHITEPLKCTFTLSSDGQQFEVDLSPNGLEEARGKINPDV